ncbi:hypothetical protein GF362_00425 [Candidatus Dojkabacteria bacterium]|nr:hypothetical protein [Candidatus Dojkabacteria bacterium]
MKKFPKKKKKKRFKTAKEILLSNDWLDERKKSAKYITKEYQDYGVRLAHKLNDPDHKSLYIKLAKEEKRGLLEKAASFALDYPNAKSKAKVFMWKLKELRKKFNKKKQNKSTNKQMELIS